MAEKDGDRYSIFRSRTIGGLTESVNYELGNGYELVGGPFFFIAVGHARMICQAVMAPKPKKDARVLSEGS